jgi:hypothetical protein
MDIGWALAHRFTDAENGGLKPTLWIARIIRGFAIAV